MSVTLAFGEVVVYMLSSNHAALFMSKWTRLGVEVNMSAKASSQQASQFEPAINIAILALCVLL